MSRKEHPYQELERLKAWKVLNRAIGELIDNGDMEELTARPYIVGYLLKQLSDAKVISQPVNGAAKPLHREIVNRG